VNLCWSGVGRTVSGMARKMLGLDMYRTEAPKTHAQRMLLIDARKYSRMEALAEYTILSAIHQLFVRSDLLQQINRALSVAGL
jgi:hypothetical protein